MLRVSIYLIVLAVALAFPAPARPAAALTLTPTGNPYYFGVAESASCLHILGRSLTLSGHNVYVEHEYLPTEVEIYNDYSDNERRDRELKELYEGKRVLLVDGAGREYEPVNVHVARFPYFGWGSRIKGQIIEFSYPAEASGNLELAIKADADSVTRLDLGPADKNYFRRATVTADEGLNFRISPSLAYAAAEVLEEGDTFFLLGCRSFACADETMEKLVYFYEVIRDGREGWVARGVEGEDDAYFIVGDFAAF